MPTLLDFELVQVQRALFVQLSLLGCLGVHCRQLLVAGWPRRAGVPGPLPARPVQIAVQGERQLEVPIRVGIASLFLHWGAELDEGNLNAVRRPMSAVGRPRLSFDDGHQGGASAFAILQRPRGRQLSDSAACPDASVHGASMCSQQRTAEWYFFYHWRCLGARTPVIQRIASPSGLDCKREDPLPAPEWPTQPMCGDERVQLQGTKEEIARMHIFP